MINEKAPCPNCNELIWVGVPEGYKLMRVQSIKHSDGHAHSRMSCPHCSKEAVIWVTRKK
jgi:predicted RNA-binding Zn-ribbon protein involved in translation (DUF1610 family)